MLAFLVAATSAFADPPRGREVLPDPCTAANPKEVVVCGSRDRSQRYRMPKLSSEYERSPIRAETRIAGIPARAHVDSVDLPGGLKSNRVMVTISTGF